MVRVLAFLTATTILAGCAAHEVAPPPPAPAEVVPPVPEAPPAPKPQFGAYGFDSAGMDTAVVPGDNFYQFANGTWLKNTPIPADKSNYGSFTMLDDLSRQRTRDIIDEQSKDPNSKIGAAYANFMDQAAVESKGLAPFQPWLTQVKMIKSRAALPGLYAEAMKLGIGTPFGGFVGQDDKAPDQYILQLFQSGLGMPDRDYYLSKDAKLAETRQQYAAHLTKMLTLAGEPNAAARAAAIVAFETKIAAASWTKVESRDATKTYNKLTLAQLTKSAPGFNFGDLIRASGAEGVSSLIVAQPTAITKISGLVSRAPLAVLKDQLLVRSLDAYASYLPAAFDNENFAFYGTTLSGTP